MNEFANIMSIDTHINACVLSRVIRIICTKLVQIFVDICRLMDSWEECSWVLAERCAQKMKSFKICVPNQSGLYYKHLYLLGSHIPS